MGAVGTRALGIALSLLVCGGCQRTFTKRVRQPNPLSDVRETLKESVPVRIVTGDIGLTAPVVSGASGGSVYEGERVPLINEASFVVVSRDRLRFHLRLEHKWEEYTDLSQWDVRLTDDKGREFKGQVEDARTAHVTKVWETETRSVARDRSGDISRVNNDGHLRRQQLSSLVMFRGRGDLVFFSEDLFSDRVRWLELSLARRGTKFRFRWEFAEDAVSGDTVTASR